MYGWPRLWRPAGITFWPLFGPVPCPFAVAIHKLSPCVANAVGYQSVGMNPAAGCGLLAVVSVEFVRSNTAIAFSIAVATSNFFPSADNARATGEDPPKDWPGSFVENQRAGVKSRMEIAATMSAFESVTYSVDSSGLSRSAVGCDPGAILDSGSNKEMRLVAPVARLSSAIREAFHKLHQARRPPRDTTTV